MSERPAPERLVDLDAAVEAMLARIAGPLKLGVPLGMGKPHRLLNALYARVERDPSRPLHLYTALSLDPPTAGSELEARFLDPFVERIYGKDFPRLAYVAAQKRDALPAHVEVEEFYLQSGALLKSAQAQRRYASLNYTHVAAALADRGMNALVQKVATNADGSRLSLSCNPDLTFDAIDAVVARGLPRPLLVAEIDPQLPWIDGTAAVDADFFDIIVSPPAPYLQLFALPRQPVGDVDYAIGLYASALVRDGGTLQIGIGALSDALCHALVLRHVDNAAYRRVLQALDPGIESHPAVVASGGLGPFEQGLFGCSEMLNEGFRLLVERGVIRRLVVDDIDVMRRMADGDASDDDLARMEREGQFLHGAFYLGSPAFYDWLRDMPEGERRRIGMRRVSQVNDLFGDEALQRLQRREARFFNTCMMATALGAAISDSLADGRVVSGVGGQYNFVAMAHELRDARSVLLLRAFRDEGGDAVSNIRWNYGATTIPRHLRDLYITEYGIADVLGKADEDCVIAMAGIADSRHQAALIERAKRERKLRADFAAPDAWRRNTPERLCAALAPFRKDGTLPDYPLGSDFTEVEQRLVRALQWLKAGTASTGGKLRTIAAALATGKSDDREALQRMKLDAPRGLREWLDARLVSFALSKTV
ncbi:acetyl-CoA hydrolase [Pseudoluteimonas lycopersici]|uniref:Acetyl-CoA hydrolase n=1 Tax=Pseudoluteimonas lycopersici TaxID=1324796 RepID=A0A516V540_9GAMM|nr:acetyl-CoA hydrolase/transferase C-terminal domain-containing protein [Lysobacter lycopersici]QDQ73644.1 acetyl-CoA hydrolase [Lysobacter lycopersici]